MSTSGTIAPKRKRMPSRNWLMSVLVMSTRPVWRRDPLSTTSHSSSISVTPHAFPRAYITFTIAAGYDIPYAQAQVGHVDPSMTLGICAQLMARRDRDDLRAEIPGLLGVASTSDRPRRSA